MAAAVVLFPLLYLPCRAAFAGIDREMEDIAHLFGANGLQVFWHVSLPMARGGIFAGLMLAFCRALGEFGATVMVMGDTDQYRTLPIMVYNEQVGGGMGSPGAVAAVSLLTAVSLAIALFYNRSRFAPKAAR